MVGSLDILLSMWTEEKQSSCYWVIKQISVQWEYYTVYRHLTPFCCWNFVMMLPHLNEHFRMPQQLYMLLPRRANQRLSSCYWITKQTFTQWTRYKRYACDRIFLHFKPNVSEFSNYNELLYSVYNHSFGDG